MSYSLANIEGAAALVADGHWYDLETVSGTELGPDPMAALRRSPTSTGSTPPSSPLFSRHHPDEIDLPATFDDPGDGWPAHMRQNRSRGVDNDGARPWVFPFGPSPELLRAHRAALA